MDKKVFVDNLGEAIRLMTIPAIDLEDDHLHTVMVDEHLEKAFDALQPNHEDTIEAERRVNRAAMSYAEPILERKRELYQPSEERDDRIRHLVESAAKALYRFQHELIQIEESSEDVWGDLRRIAATQKDIAVLLYGLLKTDLKTPEPK